MGLSMGTPMEELGKGLSELKKKEDQVWILQFFLEGRTKYSRQEIWRERVEQRVKERPSRDCSTWGSISHADTKPRHYC